ncbi:MAG: hypothetical protein ACM3L9_03365 [Deltaproteobacteria bacterium]
MAQKSAARGRPKGTGLDDAGPLAAIGKMIAANPGMKPTTAIKALGITNPSAVRRLRDKYQQSIATPPRPAAIPASNVISLSTRAAVVQREASPAPAGQGVPAAKPASDGDEAPAAADEHPAAGNRLEKPDLFAAAYAASIATAKTAIHLHYKSCWFAFQFSPYAVFIRNAEFTRLVLSSMQDRNGLSR